MKELITVRIPNNKLIEVRLKSRMKTGLKAKVDVEIKPDDTVLRLAERVQSAGGAAAEYLGEKHGDNIDPNDAGKWTIWAFREEVLILEELSKPLDEKLVRIRGKWAELSPAERELIDQLSFHVNAGTPVTRNALIQLNDIVRRIYSE